MGSSTKGSKAKPSKSALPKSKTGKAPKEIAAKPKKGKIAQLKDALLGKAKKSLQPEKKLEKGAKKAVGKAAAEKPAEKHVEKHAKNGKPAEIVKPAKAGSPEGKKAPRAAKPAISAEDVCREVACEGLATTVGYCRLHYIKNWKKIQRKAVILRERKLNQYIEELVAKYPDKYIEAIRQDLENDKDFAKVIRDLDLDESVDEFEGEGEPDEGLIDNIRREIEDEGETF